MCLLGNDVICGLWTLKIFLELCGRVVYFLLGCGRHDSWSGLVTRNCSSRDERKINIYKFDVLQKYKLPII